jgi:hypothetical protein
MSCRRLRAALLIAAFAVVFVGQESLAQKENKAGKTIDSAKLGPGEYVGIIRATPGSDRLFTIEIQSTQMVPSGSLRRVGRAVVAGTKTQTTRYEIEFQASPKAKVRTLVLPEQFDDKGKPKKYTSKQLAELKGKDKHLVGYESSLEKLESGQVVRVVLGAAPAKAAAKPKEKDKDAAGDEAAKPDKKMQASLIVITKDENASSEKPRKKD